MPVLEEGKGTSAPHCNTTETQNTISEIKPIHGHSILLFIEDDDLALERAMKPFTARAQTLTDPRHETVYVVTLATTIIALIFIAVASTTVAHAIVGFDRTDSGYGIVAQLNERT